VSDFVGLWSRTTPGMIARVHLLDQQLWAAVFAVIFGLIFAALFCVPGAFIANWLQPSLARWRESNRERRAEAVRAQSRERSGYAGLNPGQQTAYLVRRCLNVTIPFAMGIVAAVALLAYLIWEAQSGGANTADENGVLPSAITGFLLATTAGLFSLSAREARRLRRFCMDIYLPASFQKRAEQRLAELGKLKPEPVAGPESPATNEVGLDEVASTGTIRAVSHERSHRTVQSQEPIPGHDSGDWPTETARLSV
jgi:hypothetical protein